MGASVSDEPEIVVWTDELPTPEVNEGKHTFILGFDGSLPICGYTRFDYDQVCICPPRHFNQPHFVITGQAHHRFPELRVLEIICHE